MTYHITALYSPVYESSSYTGSKVLAISPPVNKTNQTELSNPIQLTDTYHTYLNGR